MTTMFSRVRRSGVAAVALSSAIVLSACSGGGTTAGGGGGGEHGDSIEIFLTHPGNNALSPMEGVPPAVQAAVKAVNDAGGVKGRQLKLIECNNNLDAAQSMSCAQKAVDDDVVALVGQTDLSSADTLPILEAAGIPSVGLYSYNVPYDAESPASYPLNGGSAQGYLATPYVMQQKGLKSLVVQACEYPSCGAPASDMTKLGPLYGIDVKGTVNVMNAGMPDYSPVATKTKSFAPDTVVQIIAPGTATGAARASAGVGFNPQYVANQQSVGEREIAAAEGLFKNTLLVGAFPSPRSQDIPISKQYATEMGAFNNGQTAQEWLDSVVFTTSAFNAFNGWLSVHALAAAIELIPGDEVTASTLTKVLNDRTTKIDLFGLGDWTPGVPGPSPYPRFTNMTTYVMYSDENSRLQTDMGIKPFDAHPMVEQLGR